MYDYVNIYQHGSDLPEFKNRNCNLFYDIFVGDVYEIDMKSMSVKTAEGATVYFD